MSWLKRLFGGDRARGGGASSPTTTTPVEPRAEEPWRPIARAVAGIDALGGDRDQVRVWFGGTFGGQLIVTVTFDRDGTGEVSVVDPGDDARALFFDGVAGKPISPAPSRTESRAPVPAAALAPLRQLVDGTAWTLGDISPTGTDGHTITVSVFSPARGSHRAEGWCPKPSTAMGQLTAAVMRVAILADPAVTELYWVSPLIA